MSCGCWHIAAIVEKLKQRFNVCIVDVIAAHQMEQVDKEEVDLVISTVELQRCPVDYIVVSPAFSDQDYIRVSNKMDWLQSSRNLSIRLDAEPISAKGLIEKITPIVRETIPEQSEQVMKQLRSAIRDYFRQSTEVETEIFHCIYIIC